MGKLIQALGAGVGFIAEATSRNKNKDNNQSQTISNTDSKETTTSSLSGNPAQPIADRKPSASSDKLTNESDDSDIDSSDDEATWYLDDQAEKVAGPDKQRDFQGQTTVESLLSMVISRSRPPPYEKLELDLPVILPQRRPGTKARGFVRAYAPALDEFGIDQATFLTFIENFDLAIKASPFLNVVYLGAGIAGVVPSASAQVASMVTKAVVRVAMEYQSRHRGNSYMDQINDQFFKPRGLYAVIMTYVPNAQRPISSKQTDINNYLNLSRTPSSSLLGPKLSRGDSYGDLELPESAPLVFPGISEDEKAKLLDDNVFKKGARWTGDYLDRRGQARWIHQNPDSRLNPSDDQKPTFNSSLADPNHPAFRGSLVTLVSGGYIAPRKERMADKRARKEERRAERRMRRGKSPRPGYGVGVDGGTRPARPLRERKRKRKLAKQNVLYLMVLSIPSESEMREAEQQMSLDLLSATESN